jgi:hypothetical protein
MTIRQHVHAVYSMYANTKSIFLVKAIHCRKGLSKCVLDFCLYWIEKPIFFYKPIQDRKDVVYIFSNMLLDNTYNYTHQPDQLKHPRTTNPRTIWPGLGPILGSGEYREKLFEKNWCVYAGYRYSDISCLWVYCILYSKFNFILTINIETFIDSSFRKKQW